MKIPHPSSHRFKRCLWILSILLLGASLAGCASAGLPPLVKVEQPASTEFIPLTEDGSTGQTFMARYDGMQAVSVYLAPGSPLDAPEGSSLVLHLRAGPQETHDLATAELPLAQIQQPGFYAFPLPPQPHSTRADYYMHIKLRGAGSVQVAQAPGATYLNGALYKNQEAQDAQMAFQLSYQPRLALVGLAGEILRWLGWLAIGLWLFVVPGWALLSRVWPGWSALHWAERLGLGGGLSLGLYPLLMLSSLFGLRLGALYAWLPPLAGTAYLLWKNRSSLLRMPSRPSWKEIVWSDLALIGLIVLIFAVRFWVVRSLEIPLWGDSYQHTVMAQLLVDHGGLFNSWQPYAEMQTFTYHYGFHSQAAVFHWATGLPIPQAVLWLGQILNGLAVIFLFPMAMRISGRNPWAGAAAVALAGMMLSMPMVYTNWGRYTQLAGQAILPAAITLGWTYLDSPQSASSFWKMPRQQWRSLLPIWLVLCGLALTHYRILVFAIFFFAAYFFFCLDTRNTLWRFLQRMIWIALGAGLLFLPWFVKVFAGKIITFLGAYLSTTPAQAGSAGQQYNAIGDLLLYLPALVWVAFILAVTWGLWRKERRVAIFALWWFLLLLATNPQWFNLPGGGAISNFALFIAAYIPASLMLGCAAAWIFEALLAGSTAWPKILDWGSSRRPPEQNAALHQGALRLLQSFPGRRAPAQPVAAPLYAALAAALLLAGGMWGARQRVAEISPGTYALAVRPDQRAAAWIDEHTPPEAHFLINSFFAYGGASVVGSDGGWWLPIIAHRSTTLPPLTYVSEQGPAPDYPQQVNALVAEINQKGIDHPDVIALLKARRVTHVYIGQRQGEVNSPAPLFTAQQLLASANFQPVYHQDRIWIFEALWKLVP